MLRAEEAAGLDLVHHAKHDIYHAKVVDPLRIDKLYNAGILNKRQHSNGLKLFIVHTLVEKKFIRTMEYRDPSEGGQNRYQMNNAEDRAVVLLSAQDIFYDVMHYLKRKKAKKLITLICIKEMSCQDAAAKLEVGKNKITKDIKEAFDHLSVAFERIKEKQEALEKALASRE